MRKIGLLIAVLGLASACEDDNPARHLDGGMIDSPVQMIDAPVTPQPVTVTVKYAGIGQQGVVVHFQNADSTLVATEMTDATGVASHLMNAGGYVTAIDPFAPPPAGAPQQGPSHDIRSFAGVKPGDHLRIEQPGLSPEGFTMTMTLPPQTDPAIYHYDIMSSCGSGSFLGTGSGGSTPSGIVNFDSGCSSADILVVSRDDGTQFLSYFYVANQAISAGGTLDYTAKTFSNLTTRTYALGDAPASLSSPMQVFQQIATTKGRLGTFSSTASSGSAAMASIPIPNITNGLSVIEIDSRTSNTSHQALEWGPLTTTAYTTNFGARMLVSPAAGTYSPATHVATWPEAAGVTPDFVFVEIDGSRNTTNLSTPISWQLVAPYTAGTVTFPTLPVGDFDYNFAPSDPVSVNGETVGKVPGGYDTVRALYYTRDSLTTGATGTAQFAFSLGPSLQRTKPVVPNKLQLQHRTQTTR